MFRSCAHFFPAKSQPHISTNPFGYQIPRSLVFSPLRWRAGWRLIDGVTASLRLMSVLRWLKLNSGLLTSEITLVAASVPVVALIRRRVRGSWRRRLIPTVVRLGSVVLPRSMIWRKSSSGPAGAAVRDKSGATPAASGDTPSISFSKEFPTSARESSTQRERRVRSWPRSGRRQQPIARIHPSWTWYNIDHFGHNRSHHHYIVHQRQTNLGALKSGKFSDRKNPLTSRIVVLATEA